MRASGCYPALSLYLWGQNLNLQQADLLLEEAGMFVGRGGIHE